MSEERQFRWFVVVLTAVGLAAFFFSSVGRNVMKHLHSSITGLDRRITLYDCSGGVIRSWRTQAKVEDRGGTCFFLVDGKAVTVSGTFVVEEQ